MANALAIAASMSSIIHSDVAKRWKCIIDTIHRPSIPDYEEHRPVFEDDQDIANFLQDHKDPDRKGKDLINEQCFDRDDVTTTKKDNQ